MFDACCQVFLHFALFINVVIDQWKQKGLVNENANGMLVLFSIFALMNGFYQYTDDQLRSLIGSEAEGDDLYNEFSKYLSGIILDGILN